MQTCASGSKPRRRLGHQRLSIRCAGGSTKAGADEVLVESVTAQVYTRPRERKMLRRPFASYDFGMQGPRGPLSATGDAPAARTGRPLLSVVVPVYEPDRYLITTLQSVLDQDLGADQMQIAIADDCSTLTNIDDLLGQLQASRPIEIHRSDRNRGLSGNWNRCLEIARGDIVHILHQDDRIAPGFYERMLPAFSTHPNLGMAFCRHGFVDEHDHIVRVSHRERWFAGALRNWLPKIAERQRIQCAAALVRRSIYERLGGYRPDLYYALDWEMWVRIAAHFDVWYEPRVLAFYRRHEGSETSRLRNHRKLNEDVFRAIETFAGHLPGDRRAELVSHAYENFALRALKRLGDSNSADRSLVENETAAVGIAIDRVTHPPAAAQYLRKRLRKLERRLGSRSLDRLNEPS